MEPIAALEELSLRRIQDLYLETLGVALIVVTSSVTAVSLTHASKS
jgi:hypothetical protein